MRKRVWSSYFILAFLCFALLNVRLSFVESIRGPLFGFVDLFASKRSDKKEQEIARLQEENHHLKEQIAEVKSFLAGEDHIESIYQKCVKYEESTSDLFSSFYQRRLNHLIAMLSETRWQLPAKVIYREPSNWGSALWVSVGSFDNEKYGKEIVAVDSPVVVGEHLVGVVEKVEKYKSLVRLVTDAKVAPSVRCVRGFEQDAAVKNLLVKTKEAVQLQDTREYVSLLAELTSQIERLDQEGQTEYLAKGILQGSSNPIWRSRSHILQGVGFNYDFGDEEGPPRLLHNQSDVPLFQKGDALITTGMDGVFPAGLLVAFVTKVFPMKEGAVSCSLRAKISLPEFSDLTRVTVLKKL